MGRANTGVVLAASPRVALVFSAAAFPSILKIEQEAPSAIAGENLMLLDATQFTGSPFITGYTKACEQVGDLLHDDYPVAEMSVIWLRVAAVLYSLGLLHASLTVVRRREHFFRPALAAFCMAAVLHAVSIVDEALITAHFPANNFYESLSLCAFLITALFLFVYWRYKLESLSVFIFPLVFVMTLVSTMGNPVSAWSSPVVRNAWLIVHVVLVLLGYAALLLTAVAAVVYLFQEKELKSKKPRSFYYRLPPLGTLDDLISKSMALGFVFITLAIIAGSTWAFIELGTRWIADPKIAIAFVTWGIYMAMLFARVTAGWRGRKAAIMAVAALGCSAITWVAHSGLRAILK